MRPPFVSSLPQRGCSSPHAAPRAPARPFLSPAVRSGPSPVLGGPRSQLTLAHSFLRSISWANFSLNHSNSLLLKSRGNRSGCPCRPLFQATCLYSRPSSFLMLLLCETSEASWVVACSPLSVDEQHRLLLFATLCHSVHPVFLLGTRISYLLSVSFSAVSPSHS